MIPLPPPRLTDAATAMQLLLTHMPGPVAALRVPVQHAIGRVLAETLLAASPVPDLPTAAWDGWAALASQTQGSGPFTPASLYPAPQWVRSGQPLPAGTDTVLRPWAVEEQASLVQASLVQANLVQANLVQATGPATAGDGVRAPGDDIPPGMHLCAAGHRLPPSCLPALYASGITEAAIRAPKVALLSCSPAHGSGPGLQDYLAALIAAEGAEPFPGPPVPPQASAIADAIAIAGTINAMACDLLLILGGTGHDSADQAAAGLAAAGRVLVHGIGARPGATAGFGLRGATPVILVPGRWEDAVAAWLLLARPALRHLAAAALPPPSLARLSRKVSSTVGLLDLVPLRHLGPGLVEPLDVGAVPPGVLAQTDAILLVPACSEGYDAGAEVRLETL